MVLYLIWIGCISAVAVLAQSPVTLTIGTLSPGPAIPQDFSGLSFGTISLKRGSGGYFFDSSDTQMVALFQALGTKVLRIGGTSVDTNNSNYTPADSDVDALFRFAGAAGVKVIYSLRLENGDPSQDAAMAAYIWSNYRQYLGCFAIGNEPNNYGKSDPQITSFATYLSKWQIFAAAITNAVPLASLGGPDSDSSSTGNSWGTQFAAAEAGAPDVAGIHFHYYAGASSAGLTVQQIVGDVLSSNWDALNYPGEYDQTGLSLPPSLPYRFTEANSFYTGGSAGVSGGNNCFATALFSLDFMHWWSAHQCQSACFHTSMWKYNGVFYPDSSGNYQVYPVAYGIKAFELGGHGAIQPLGMTNADGLNLTAYAVADPTNLYVTIINKEYGSAGRSAAVAIMPQNFVTANVAAMFLVASNNDPSATNGITLGGAPITDSGPWEGQWTVFTPLAHGSCDVTVPAASAAIVRITPTSELPQTMGWSNSGSAALRLNWGFGVLQSATKADGPWSDVTNAGPLTVPTTNEQTFYRVRQN